MAIEFRGVRFPPLRDLTVSAPSGAVIGVIGEKGAGKGALLRLAAGAAKPEAGRSDRERRAPLPWPAGRAATFAGGYFVDGTFARAARRSGARPRAGRIGRLRSGGSTVLIVSHELDLLQSLCDEIWWLDAGRSGTQRRSARGAGRLSRRASPKRCGPGAPRSKVPLRPAMRRGDGRAEILSLETLGADGNPTAVWQSGENATVRVTVRYHDAVEEPVIGIMIRTRIGLEVYGTNTELEKVSTGSCAAGTRMRIEFAFRCDLCPGEYTITAASHDADGTAHDWVDDAVAFAVADSRYTAGVANLRAKVRRSRSSDEVRDPVTSVPE